MIKTKNNLIMLIGCLGIFLISCEDNVEIDAVNEGLVKDALKGKWEWTGSLGGVAGESFTPENKWRHGLTFTEDSVLFEVISPDDDKVYGIRLSEFSVLTNPNHVIGESVALQYGENTMLHIDVGGLMDFFVNPAITMIDETTLELTDDMTDGYTHTFKKEDIITR